MDRLETALAVACFVNLAAIQREQQGAERLAGMILALDDQYLGVRDWPVPCCGPAARL
jgi:hypothetical protein